MYRVRLIDAPTGTQRSGAPARRPRRARQASRTRTASGNDVVSPMHGVVVEVKVAEGDAVSEGQVVAVVEAMKMMNEIRAHRNGTASKVHVAIGDAIESGSPLVTID